MPDTIKATSFTCPQCSRTSYDPNDISARYCGNCRQFEDQMPLNEKEAMRERMKPLIVALVQALAKYGAFGPISQPDPVNGGFLRLRVVVEEIDVHDVEGSNQVLAELNMLN